MPVAVRIIVIEIVRLLSLSSAAASSFVFTSLSVQLCLTLYTLFYGPLLWPEWLAFVITFALAFGPAVLVVYFPGIAAAAFDIQFGGRRLSERENAVIVRIEEKLETCALEKGIKLPVIAWRVQDTGEFNAYAYAHNRVCFTKGILHKYSGSEKGIERLAGVAAHEIGHLRNWDTRINMFHQYLMLPIDFGIGLLDDALFKIPAASLFLTPIAFLLRVPADIAHLLHGSVSQLQEYQADRFAGKLMTAGAGMAGFLDDINHLDEHEGSTFMQWLLRTHPPAELRRDALAKTVH